MNYLAENITRFKKECEFNTKQLLEALDISSYQLDMINNPKSTIRLDLAEHLCSQLNVSLRKLYCEKIEISPCISNIKKLNQTELPEKYSYLKFSKTKALEYVFNFIDKKYGILYRKSILRDMQVTPSFFEDLNNTINLNFVYDLYNRLYQKGCDQKSFKSIGETLVNINKKTFRDNFKDLHKDVDIFESLFTDLISIFERNFHYWVDHVSLNEIIIKSQMKKDLKGNLKDFKNNSHVCHMKTGALGSMLTTKGFPVSKIIKTHCEFKGSNHCSYTITRTRQYKYTKQLLS